jgi:protein-disulfide isomerase/uncharacterized membrane protein
MSRNRIALVVLLALAGAVLSGLLLFDHHGVGPAQAALHRLCGDGDQSGCEQVSRSRYSSLGAFSLAALGLGFYGSVLLLLALALVVTDEARASASALALVLFGAAALVDLVLLGIQAFSIGAYCALCIATYAVNLAAVAVLLPARSKVSTLIRGQELRPFAVWALGSLVILVSIAAVDRAFASRPEEPVVNLLGEPAPPPPAPPAPEASTTSTSVPESVMVPETTTSDGEIARLRGELERARAEVNELRATLDDPQKFQTYQTEKAAQAFENEARRTLALEGVPFKGPAEAPIQVVEFSDFLCPFCRNLASAFNGFMPGSQGRVAIFYKNYPLDQDCNPALSRTVHEGACELALGGICAHEQGKFWPYHDRVFSQPPENPTAETVVGIASSAGLDGNALRQCLSSSAAKEKLDRDIQEARGLQINSTPSVFINGKKLDQIPAFLKAVESEMKRLGLAPASP